MWAREYEVAVNDLVEEHHGGRGHNIGTVTKIGSKLIHVASTWGSVTHYRKDDHQRNDGHPGYIVTAKQRDDIDRTKAATELLRAHGVEFRHSTDPQWTVEQMERLVKAVVNIRNPIDDEWPS